MCFLESVEIGTRAPGKGGGGCRSAHCNDEYVRTCTRVSASSLLSVVQRILQETLLAPHARLLLLPLLCISWLRRCLCVGVGVCVYVDECGCAAPCNIASATRLSNASRCCHLLSFPPPVLHFPSSVTTSIFLYLSLSFSLLARIAKPSWALSDPHETYRRTGSAFFVLTKELNDEFETFSVTKYPLSIFI